VIALFDEPPRISIDPKIDIGRNGLLMGMAVLGGENSQKLVGIVIRENGDISFLPADLFTVDYRYDVSRNIWIDTNAPEADQ
jgi:hypothetical protein